MFGGGSDAAEASNRLGLPLDLVNESESFQGGVSGGVYPDNWQAVGVFVDLMTQWRMGTMGATGLDYNALPVVLTLRGVKRVDRQEVFNSIQTMERAALKHMEEKRK